MTGRDPRMSGPTLKVLKVYLSGEDVEVFGAEITRRTGVLAGTLYPMLARLEAAGWLSSRWEEADPRNLGRPRQKFYRLTDFGLVRARAVFAEFQLAPA